MKKTVNAYKREKGLDVYEQRTGEQIAADPVLDWILHEKFKDLYIEGSSRMTGARDKQMLQPNLVPLVLQTKVANEMSVPILVMESATPYIPRVTTVYSTGYGTKMVNWQLEIGKETVNEILEMRRMQRQREELRLEE